MASQLTTVRLTRGDSTPWGFRLQGGNDWGLPLSVSKVNPGSLAETGGLKVGDIIVKIAGQGAETISHTEAQEVIVRAGNNLEITVTKGGTSTWKPSVTPVGNVPKPRPVSAIFDPQPVTKTSLAHSQPASKPIGTSHNTTAAPFATFGTSTIPLVNKQFNSPINLYSMQNIKETLEAHTEILAPGVKGINFMKPDAPVNTHSAVYQAILEEEAKSKSTPGNNPENQLLENLRHSSVSPTTQSCAFRRLQAVLDSGEGGSPVPQTLGVPTGTGSPVPPRGGFPPHIGHKPASSQPTTRHVEAPITAPRSLNQEAQNQNVCSECGRLIVGVFCRINDRSLHAECFKCATCGNSLKNVGYLNINDKLYCELHAQQVAKINSRPPFEPMVLPVATSAGSTSNPVHPSGKTSPLVSAVAAMPWHTASTYHHVDAPVSPVPGQGPTATTGFSLLPNLPTPFSASSASQPVQQSRTAATQAFQPSRQQQPMQQQQFQQFNQHQIQQQQSMQQTVNAGKFSWPPKAGGSGSGFEMPGSMSCETGASTSQSVVGSSTSASNTIFAASCTSNMMMMSSSSTASETESSNTTMTKCTAVANAPTAAANVTITTPGPEPISQGGPTNNFYNNKPNNNSINMMPEAQSQNLKPSTPDELAAEVINQALPAAAAAVVANSQEPLPASLTIAPPITSSSSFSSSIIQSQQPLPTVSKPGPPTFPKPTPPSNAVPTPWSSGPQNINVSNPPRPTGPPAPCGSLSGPGKSIVAGLRQPMRGRGQLKTSTPGTRIPICGVCQVPIRGPFIVAIGKTWCPDHFNCANNQCKRSLVEVGFVEEQGQLYCENCFKQYLAPTCSKCNVRIDGECLIALEKHWHSQCFSCSFCKCSLGRSTFFLEDGQPYCEKDWNELFTTKCISCGFPIEAGDRWVEALNNNYHSQCFKCTVCQKNLEGQSFFAKGGRPFCKAHAR